ncbi:recombinase family protein [Flavobacteriaceae bacterium]|nr:recombinase family protein [Flavobacteriaceae bacterium]MDB2568309.1 recombinase family protein [Flavobacteriaceae bacterium]MDC0378382.1 recombinase family protein [Flavobacteriaceae bacterium]|tara:strand:- start:489 stop:1094 length:606 start_codon:yes stop_codon:yes gene_type:complete
MIIKYNRTSTINQKGERFKLDKENYDLTINDFGVSGKIPFNRREGGSKLIELVKEGKVTKIVFEDLSRCGRTLKDSINTLDYFFENSVIIKVRNIGIESHTPNGEKNPMWNIVTSILSSVYEMERERILEITEMGRKQYVLNGGKLGRKVGSEESEMVFLRKPQTKSIIKFLKMGKTNRDIIGRLNCSPKTITKVRKLVEC